MSEVIARIQTLNKENYDTWKMQMRALLIKNNFWGYVSGKIVKPETPPERVESWVSNDEKAMSDIILYISPSELKQVKGCQTSREAWLKLEDIYQSKGPARKATLVKKLALSKMQEGDDVREHIRKMFDAIDKLNEMGVELDKDVLTITILYSLPSSYENFRCAIESRDELPSPEVIRVKIIEESDARRNETRGVIQNAMIAKKKWNTFKKKLESHEFNNNKGLFKYNCHKCGKRGHKAVDCKEKKNENFRQHVKMIEDVSLCAVETVSDNNSQKTLKAENVNPINKWCLDSGATSHLCKEAHAFIKLSDSNCGKLNLADNNSTEIVAKGTVSFMTNVNGIKKNVCLNNVLQVPDLRENLLSVAKITDNNCNVLFTKQRAIIFGKDNSIKLIANRIGNLYFIQEDDENECRTITEKLDRNKFSENIETWHRRLGHLNLQDLKKGVKEKTILGINLGKYEDNLSCEICLRGKMTRSPFPKKSERKTDLLEIIHSDICGPMRIESNSKAKYYITFIDDHSRWCEVRFLKKKSDTFKVFKEYKALVENQKEKKIKSLQSDNGTEYVNNEFNEFLQENGIRRRLTVPYSPQQNGTAERKNRTLIEMARCLLIQSGLPSSFWAEAVNTANYIRNRCPTKSLNGRTPYEAWYGRPPNVSFFREFGKEVIVLDKSPGKLKIEERGKKGIFLGYDDKSKGYRVWIPEKKIVEITRDVVFLNNSNELMNKIYEDFIPKNELVLENIPQKGINIKVSDPVPNEMEVITKSKLNRNENNEEIISENDSLSRQNENNENIVSENNSSSNRNENIVSENDDEDTEDQEIPRRGPGRPKKILTGRRGRPCKVFHIKRNNEESTQQEEVHLAEIPVDQAISGADAQEWFRAMAIEVKSIIKNDTWEIVERPVNQEVIGNRMILKNKYNPDGTLERRKARLVAKGFAQRPGVHFNQTFAPVARLESIRLLVALAAEYGLSIKQFDVTTAYLNGVIEEEVFMEVPNYLEEILDNIIQMEKNNNEVRKKAEDMREKLKTGNKVCLLKKSLYGLRQAGRSWHKKFDEVLRKLGLTPTNADPCVYYSEQDENALFIAIYVDDIIAVSRSQLKIKNFKEALSKEFEIKYLGDPKCCLGIEFLRNGNNIIMHQKGYIRELLERFGMVECKPVTTPIDINSKLIMPEKEITIEDKKLPYRELVGSLMYLAVATRPDITHAVGMLSQFNNCYTHVHWVAAKRVLRYLKGSMELGITFNPSNKSLQGFVDADWANCHVDRRSYTGYIFMLAEGAISWSSSKQKTVALSSTEAEYMALAEATKEAIHLRRFLSEIGFSKLANVKIFCDNIGAKKLAENPLFHARSKHIDIRHHFVRDALKSNIIDIEYLPTDNMIADILTKGLATPKHRKFVELMGLKETRKI